MSSQEENKCVFKMGEFAMTGPQEVYKLTADGEQTIQDTKATKSIDMEQYWNTMGPTIEAVMKEETDQVDIDAGTCPPFYDIELVAKDGRKRSFQISGTPKEGAKLQSGAPVPEMYIKLFNFATKSSE
eukprot:TRINITY_DN3506_c0_g1_i1.p1 TRINITY_DN3506_c0_g1~~TRINITY_DN3506_c0_g1_i1.p1  ORF type:complete len:128 (+),score=36.52 TRINITY_DN3506_c0_g1_i1:146-529(+)